ncbi:MAG TPA: nucleotidyltransferase domain-containing protein [Nanoarchaeota archaeon]|nr:nucleotidyltransferase domain-containing protein [Nanoarchaeota archaeon]HIH34212.1 nucleotidyltransferase domain-containing protein [Nanoarchaeota archaeon]HIH66070.1 nucleotidyltransferase domain-containing protein [Nanoarchaeota archaeon]
MKKKEVKGKVVVKGKRGKIELNIPHPPHSAHPVHAQHSQHPRHMQHHIKPPVQHSSLLKPGAEGPMSKEKEIAYDFAIKAYKRFSSEVLKSVVLFGSQAKGTASQKSDIDVILIVDDATIDWTSEMVAWYREELAKVIAAQEYARRIHVNTVRLTTWWEEMLRGEPVVMNIIRYGEPLVDFGGFFTPLKVLLQKGKIRPTPEAIYIALRRSPAHIARSKASILGMVEGLYWACVDSAHAALMSAGRTPPSPEHIGFLLYETFVKAGKLKVSYVELYRELYKLMHDILHGEIKQLKGALADAYVDKVDSFVGEMARLVRELQK